MGLANHPCILYTQRLGQQTPEPACITEQNPIPNPRAVLLIQFMGKALPAMTSTLGATLSRAWRIENQHSYIRKISLFDYAKVSTVQRQF